MARSGVACVLLLLIVAGCPAFGASSPDGTKLQFIEAQGLAEAAVVAGDFEKAVTFCEGFVRDHPDTPSYTGTIVVLANRALNALRETGELGARRSVAIAEGLLTRHGRSPDMMGLAAAFVARWWLTGAPKAERDPAKADELLVATITQLGERLPVDYYLGYNLFVLRLQVLRAQGNCQEGLDLAGEYAEVSPWMLGDMGFLREVYYLARETQNLKLQMSAARAFYGLCEFTNDAVQDATEAVALTLKANGGPGTALQFAKAQESDQVRSPLRDIAMLDLGDAEAMLRVAGKDLEAQLNVNLYRGDVPAAIDNGRALLRRSSNQNAYFVAKALRNLARCFKAHDLALPRANAFLAYHSSGTGENPLDQLEAELAAEAAGTQVAKGE